MKREGGLFYLHLAVWPQVSLEPLWISASHTVRDTGLGTVGAPQGRESRRKAGGLRL